MGVYSSSGFLEVLKSLYPSPQEGNKEGIKPVRIATGPHCFQYYVF